ncbi:MAG: hypothetical protein ACD_78C00084G0002 [uncultured bacterium (gcode 4)]|uniref:Uncharacterized protein n=1 Tax=uncultured bacterium (gcode 4) TaxID=1234023 RepID=K1XJ04_9BACT|nr:MAG: hypothetical protein ACD_78C00084G0002 [uncultured bacterium (gcode 4)]
MHFTHTDFLKFFLYTTVFFLLFFGYNTVSGPYFETTFDSASIQNQEVPISPVFTEQQVIIPKKSAVKPSLTIAFNPDYTKIDNDVVNHLKEIIQSSYFQTKTTPLHLVLDSERQEPRGQVVGNKLILSTTIPSDSEQLKVFVHELGHIVDIFYLKKGFFADPSDVFYALSWESFNTKKKEQKMTNFVSGYALSNKYEDFSESFSWYVFHNEDFLKRAKKDTILQKKYDFFKYKVFGMDAFIDTSFWIDVPKDYNWDTTKVPVDTKKYLYYIK